MNLVLLILTFKFAVADSFEGTWESLKSRKIPEWYDGKKTSKKREKTTQINEPLILTKHQQKQKSVS